MILNDIIILLYFLLLYMCLPIDTFKILIYNIDIVMHP